MDPHSPIYSQWFTFSFLDIDLWTRSLNLCINDHKSRYANSWYIYLFQESQMATVENDISRDTLEAAQIRSRIERLQKIMDGLDDEIQQKNDIISRSEAEIIKRNAIIERKQGVIDQYNKKLEHMITSAGV